MIVWAFIHGRYPLHPARTGGWRNSSRSSSRVRSTVPVLQWFFWAWERLNPFRNSRPGTSLEATKPWYRSLETNDLPDEA